MQQHETEKKYGSADVAWGDVYRYRMNEIDLPANGGLPNLGIFMSRTFEEDKDKKNL